MSDYFFSIMYTKKKLIIRGDNLNIDSKGILKEDI